MLSESLVYIIFHGSFLSSKYNFYISNLASIPNQNNTYTLLKLTVNNIDTLYSILHKYSGA